jgi:hypothetical protein
MWAIECTFWHPTIAAANNQKATWVGKPGYLGGYTRVGVPNSPLIPDAAIGYWAVGEILPNSSTRPSFCKLVKLETSLNYILGIT